MILLPSHSGSNEGSPEKNGDGCREIANHNHLLLVKDGLPPHLTKSLCCDGFQIEIFSDKSEEVTENVFTAAVGFEILKDSVSDAEQFAMDVIESEEKEYVRWIEGYILLPQN